METKIALATPNGYIRFENNSVLYVSEARDASVFANRHEANAASSKHGVRGGYIMVDVSEELAKALVGA